MSVFSNAKWIWIKDSLKKDVYGEFSSKFITKRKKAKINLSCDSDYTLFINGKYVASNQYSDFEHYKVYDCIDISKYIKKGENNISVLVWYFGEDSQKYYTYKAGLIFEVLDDNRNQILVSNKDVLSRISKTYSNGRCKTITSQIGFGFAYDITKEDKWLKGKLNDFSNSVEVEKDCKFFARPNKKLELKKRIDGKKTIISNTNVIVDLQKEVFGLLSFEIYSEKAQKLLISFGENLVDGKVDRLIGGRDFSVEINAKEGKNIFTNYMLRFGCRFFEISSTSKIKVKHFGLIPTCYPVIERKYNAVNKDFEKIYNLCVNTLKLSMSEHYMDCPWREQALYAFDSRNQMLTGYSAFKDGNKEYVKSCLKLISEDWRKSGLLSICYPCGSKLMIPSFSLYNVIQVKEYLEFSGDITFVNSIFDRLISIIEFFNGNVKNGLIQLVRSNEHWNFYDWVDGMSDDLFFTQAENKVKHESYKKSDLMINCLFIIALNCLKYICEKTKKDFMYDKVLGKLKITVKETFFDSEDKLFAFYKGQKNYYELANSLAILCDLCTEEERSFILEKISKGKLISCTLSMRAFKYDALLTVGDKYKDIIIAEIKKDYLYMLSCDADCAWETIDGKKAFDNAGSLCHGWSAIPAYYLVKFGLITLK